MHCRPRSAPSRPGAGFGRSGGARGGAAYLLLLLCCCRGGRFSLTSGHGGPKYVCQSGATLSCAGLRSVQEQQRLALFGCRSQQAKVSKPIARVTAGSHKLSQLLHASQEDDCGRTTASVAVRLRSVGATLQLAHSHTPSTRACDRATRRRRERTHSHAVDASQFAHSPRE